MNKDKNTHTETFQGCTIKTFHFREGCHDRFYGQVTYKKRVWHTMVLPTEQEAIFRARDLVTGDW